MKLIYDITSKTLYGEPVSVQDDITEVAEDFLSKLNGFSDVVAADIWDNDPPELTLEPEVFHFRAWSLFR